MSAYGQASVSDSRCRLQAAAADWPSRLPCTTMFYFVVGVSLCFAVVLWGYLNARLANTDVGSGIRALIYFKAAVEVWCSLYAAYFVFISVYYLATRNRAAGTSVRALPDACEGQTLAIVYLCCSDLDEQCLESLARTKSTGGVKIFVHDDSEDAAEQLRVDRCVESLRGKYACAFTVLRRGTHEGGKPGALNFVLANIDDTFTWMLICDNDSHAPDAEWFRNITPMLQDEQIACVQFRNIGPDDSRQTGGLSAGLGESIDVFDVFLAPSELFGWQPFLGHNAVLRIAAVREVGGFTPGEFADDIDLSVRLNLAGYRIRYNPAVVFQETHPNNYRAFRARSYKWAYGCGSVLRRWALKMIASPTLRREQKFFFFMFIGFYYTQILLLAYLVISYILLPFLIVEYDFSPVYSVLGGTLVVVLMYLPTLAYFSARRRLRQWPRLAASVGMVYGSIDFVSAKAVMDCLFKRPRTWIPTNTVRSHATIPWSAWLESATGFALLAVPFVMLPHLLYLPCSYLFALKFLVVPALYLAYVPNPEVVS